jgi:hypothetical protein
MLLLLCRTLPDNVSLPVDQRWRSVELDPEVFPGLDLTVSQGVAAAVRRVVDGQVPNVAPFPHGADVQLVDTDRLDRWTVALTVTKAV